MGLVVDDGKSAWSSGLRRHIGLKWMWFCEIWNEIVEALRSKFLKISLSEFVVVALSCIF